MFQRLWVWIRHHILDGHFFTYLFDVKFVMCVWKDKNKWKRGQGWPIFFLKKYVLGLRFILYLARQNYEPTLAIVMLLGKCSLLQTAKYWKNNQFGHLVTLETTPTSARKNRRQNDVINEIRFRPKAASDHLHHLLLRASANGFVRSFAVGPAQSLPSIKATLRRHRGITQFQTGQTC